MCYIALFRFIKDEKLKTLYEWKQDQYQKLADAVYYRRGWTPNGVPTPQKMKKLGFTDKKMLLMLQIKIDEDFEEDLAGALDVDAEEELDMEEPASMEEEFDFSMDSSEISKKIDQLDTIFFDDTEAEDELDEDAVIDEETAEANDEAVPLPETVFEDIEDEIETEDIGVSGNESVDVPLAVGGIAAMDASQGHLEEILEQIIERKFSDKIETLITQIIEKAVSKEIQRLKKILLEDDVDEDL